MTDTTQKIIGKCHICKQIRECEYCSICNHWFCQECGFKLFSRAVEAVKEFLGAPEENCCGESKIPKFAIIYSKKTGRIRRFSTVTDGIPEISPVKDGENMLVFEEDKYGDLYTLQNLINTVTGLTPTDDRYAIIDNKGDVQGSILADPEGCGDSVPDMVLVKHANADKGWIYDKEDGFINLDFILVNKKKPTDKSDEKIAFLSSDSKSQVVYTVDGTNPSVMNGEVYNGEFAFDKNKTIKYANKYKDKIGRIITLSEPI